MVQFPGTTIKRGEYVFTYLDIDAGLGVNDTPLNTDFLFYGIQLRSGLFRLAAKTEATIIPVVSGTDIAFPMLHFGPKISTYSSSNKAILQNHAQQCMTFFSKQILSHPYAWFHWQTHHFRSLQEEYNSGVRLAHQSSDRAPEWVVCNDGPIPLKLNMSTGILYNDKKEDGRE